MEIIRNYENQEQYKQVFNLDGFQREKILSFEDKILKSTSVIDYIVPNKCIPDNFYYFILKQNKYKANRLYIYKDKDKYTIDFISEYKDNSKGIVVRNIKKTIPNISLESLIICINQ